MLASLCSKWTCNGDNPIITLFFIFVIITVGLKASKLYLIRFFGDSGEEMNILAFRLK